MAGPQTRQGPRRVSGGRRSLADRHYGPHLRLRLRSRLGHSRQGARAHPNVALLVRPAARPGAQSLSQCFGGRRARPQRGGSRLARGAHYVCAQVRHDRRRVRRSRVPGRQWLEGLSAHGRGLRHSVAGWSARWQSLAHPHFYSRHQGRDGPRRECLLRTRRRQHWACARIAVKGTDPGHLLEGSGVCRVTRHYFG